MRAAQPVSTFRQLPIAARAYVSLVVLAGAASLIVAAMSLHYDHVGLFGVLLGLAVRRRRRRSICRSAAASRTCRCRTR